MLIDLTGKKLVSRYEHTVCEFHKTHPGVPYAGCCCSASYSQSIEDDPKKPEPCPHCGGTGVKADAPG